MLTKIGIAALLGTIGTAAVGGTAKADEPCRTESGVTIAAPGVVVSRPIVVAPPVVTPVAYGYGTPGVYYRNDYERREWLERGRRESLERMRREQREAAMRRAAWLHQHGHRW